MSFRRGFNLTVLISAPVGLLLAISLHQPWFMVIPFCSLLWLIIEAAIYTQEVANRKKIVSIQTNLVTVGLDKKPCTILIYPDKILITSRHQRTSEQNLAAYRANKARGIQIGLLQGIDAEIPLSSISDLLYEASQKVEGAQFGIDYEDEYGSATVLFWNEGIGSVRRTKRIIKEIQAAHQRVTEQQLVVIDRLELNNMLGSQIVHRMP